MTRIVKPDELAFAIAEMMEKYTDEVVEALEDEIDDVSDEGIRMLKAVNMPSMTGQDNPPARHMTRRAWRKYSKGWRKKKDEKSDYTNVRIHNGTDWQLTHLLENGHATKNGTYTRKFEHIKPIEEYCVKTLEENTIKIIEKGGKL